MAPIRTYDSRISHGSLNDTDQWAGAEGLGHYHVMRNASPEYRLIALLRSLSAEGSPTALYLGDLLKEGPPTTSGEAQLVADGVSSIIALLGALCVLPAVGLAASLDWLAGRGVANIAGGLFFAPAVFLLTLAGVLQVAKFRGRFDGLQPHLGRWSWGVCVVVTAAVAVLFAAA